MVSPNDFISLTYEPDLTEAGIAYACKRLAQFGPPKGEPAATQLRQIVAEIGVELAIRRYLLKEKIPHKYFLTRPFSDPDRKELTVGERRCFLVSYLISRKQQIKMIRKRTQNVLKIPALVDESQRDIYSLNDDDVLIFTILSGLITSSLHGLQRAATSNQPIFQIHILPQSWSGTPGWQPIGPLICQADLENTFTLEIGGLDQERSFISEKLMLESEDKSFTNKRFFSAQYVGTRSIPKAAIKLTSPILNQSIAISPRDWRNIWVYGIEILLMGFITCRDYFSRSTNLPIGSQTFQYSQTKKKFRSLPISDLSSLSEFFTRAKSWSV